jgi:hypothetical protein
MKFMMFVAGNENSGPPPQALMDAIGKLGEDATQRGVMVQMGGLLPSAMGAKVRISKGKLGVTDGPFTEAKELVGGFAVFDVKSRAEAIEEARKFMELHRVHWPQWEGVTEVRQIFDAADFAPPGA